MSAAAVPPMRLKDLAVPAKNTAPARVTIKKKGLLARAKSRHRCHAAGAALARINQTRQGRENA